jgi:acyl-CoA reductase-like NAD-dependent aldehyde dehydrogenase
MFRHVPGLHPEIPLGKHRGGAALPALPVKVGDIEDFGNFMGAVIDKTSYETLRSSIAYAKNHQDATIVYGVPVTTAGDSSWNPR